ncbi:MAG: cytochrome b [Alphaproteobacteria bacterium]|nr:cytochrome b [Alphaproteobacteria bacterium]
MPAVGYRPVAKALHWITAIAVFGLLALGFWMVDLPINLTKLQAFAWHKWIGLTVLLLTLARIAWRWYAPPPPLPDTVTSWERRLAPLSHGALLFLLLAQPVSGWLMSSAGGVEIFWFGLIPLPNPVPRDPDLVEVFRIIHEWLAWTLMGVLTLHLAAVVRHDVFRRDGIFRRMWRSR